LITAAPAVQPVPPHSHEADEKSREKLNGVIRDLAVHVNAMSDAIVAAFDKQMESLAKKHKEVI